MLTKNAISFKALYLHMQYNVCGILYIKALQDKKNIFNCTHYDTWAAVQNRIYIYLKVNI